MADKVKAKYKQLEKDLLLPFLDGDVVADTAAVLSNKLLQLANGAVYDCRPQHHHLKKAEANLFQAACISLSLCPPFVL